MRRKCITETCRKWANLNADGYCPTCKPVAATEALDTETIKCGTCEQEVQETDEKAVGCDICGKWYHQACVNIPNELLTLLDAVNNTDAETPTYNLLWVCLACNSEPKKTVEISKNSCEIINTVSSRAKGNAPICQDYRHGKKCKQGEKCKFSHPEKCLNYCRFGRDGCSGGFMNCKLLHPVLCRGSLRRNECFDQNCTLAHLKGTIRNPQKRFTNRFSYQAAGQSSQQIHATARSKPRYTMFDSSKLGFHSYHQSSRHNKQAYTGENSRNQVNNSNYAYNSSEYPDLMNDISQRYPPPQALQEETMPPSLQTQPPNQSIFLDLLNQIKSMQETQKLFNQEIMSLKQFLPHPQNYQNPMFHSHFNQQAPVTQPQTNPV